MGNGLIMLDDLHDSLKEPQYDTTQTMTGEVTRLNCLNKNLVSLVITGKTIINLLGVAGDCEEVSLWSTWQSTLSLDSTAKVTGNNSIKITVGAGFPDGVGLRYVELDKSKYYCLSAYLKNGNATNVVARLAQKSPSYAVIVQSQPITDTTKLNRVFMKIDKNLLTSGTSWAAEVQIIGSAGQYVNFDAVQIEEITAEDYNNPNWQPSPYVSGDTSVGDTAGRIKSVSKNLCRISTITLGKMVYNTNDIPNTLNKTWYFINLKEEIKYTISAKFNGTARVNVKSENGNMLAMVTESTPNGAASFTAPKEACILYFTNDNADDVPIIYDIQLEEGDTPTAYEPYQETSMPIPFPLRSLNGIADMQDTKKGKVIKKVERVVADGSLSWQFHINGASSSKVVKTPNMGIITNSVLYKYNNKQLTYVKGNATALDSYDFDTNYIYIDIPNSDSGWGNSYQPTPDEIKAQRFGWVMYKNESGAGTPYDGTGTKAWAYRLPTFDGIPSSGNLTAGTTTLPTTLAPNFTPDRLYYQLAQQQEIDIPVSDLVGLPGGSLIVENDAQCWVRPKVDYTVNKNSRANLDGVMSELNMISGKFNSFGFPDLKKQPPISNNGIITAINTGYIGLIPTGSATLNIPKSYFKSVINGVTYAVDRSPCFIYINLQSLNGSNVDGYATAIVNFGGGYGCSVTAVNCIHYNGATGYITNITNASGQGYTEDDGLQGINVSITNSTGATLKYIVRGFILA